MISRFRFFILITIAVAVVASGCYVYTNPWDPRAELNDFDVNSVIVEYDADAEDKQNLTIDWPDVEGMSEDDRWYSFVAAETPDGFEYDDYTSRSESEFTTGWSEGEWLTWFNLYFRISYDLNNHDGKLWSRVFHYPMDYYNPMDKGITLTTTPILRWAAVSGATSYEIEFSKTKDGLDGVPETSTADTYSSYWAGFTINIGDTIYWRIRAKTDDQELTLQYLWGRTVSFTVKAAPEVGDRYAGGYVFYLDGGGNGMIVTDKLIAEDVGWGPAATDIGGDNDAAAPELTAIGDGAANTTAILNGLGDNDGETYAAGICNDSTFRGFDDWYLPSYDEWSEVYSTIDDLRDEYSDGVNDGAGLWTSSEYDADNTYVYHEGSLYARYKEGLHNVLAVRDFTY